VNNGHTLRCQPGLVYLLLRCSLLSCSPAGNWSSGSLLHCWSLSLPIAALICCCAARFCLLCAFPSGIGPAFSYPD
jgi:hypothetical protein